MEGAESQLIATHTRQILELEMLIATDLRVVKDDIDRVLMRRLAMVVST